MRKACFTEHQIIAVIKSVETGRTVKVDDFNRETLSIKIILNLPDLRNDPCTRQDRGKLRLPDHAAHE